MNENMRKTQYAVRGELYLKAEKLRKEGKPIIFTNGAHRTCLLACNKGDRVAAACWHGAYMARGRDHSLTHGRGHSV